MDDMRTPAGRPTVVLAEDHPNVARAIEGLLREEFDVVGVVGNGIALVSLVEILRPDAVVTDIGMPEMDGIEAARHLARDYPHMPVVFVSCHDDLGIARMALEIGCGYVVKASAGEDLLDAVHAVLRGDSFVSCSLRHA